MKIVVSALILLQAVGLVTAVVPGTRVELETEDVDNNGTMALAERQEKGHGRGRAICGKYANGNYVMSKKLIWELDNKLANRDYTIGAGQCDRVHCWDTTGIYVCNDNKKPITLKGKEISISLYYIRTMCCHMGPRTKTTDNALSGKQFTPWGWNSNIGYANCNDPPSIRPTVAGGWGVNPGTCAYVDMKDQPF